MQTGSAGGRRANEPIFLAVVERIAEREGVDPLDLPPLHSSIDPDALAAVVDGRITEAKITFTYCGYEVTVDADRTITLEADAGYESDS